MTIKYSIHLEPALIPLILGSQDEILRRLNSVVQSNLVVRGNEVIVEGPIEEEKPLRKVFKDLESMARRKNVSLKSLDTVIALAGFQKKNENESTNGKGGKLVFERTGFKVYTKSENQESYVNAVRNSDIVFAVGPAGTGKTYLAVAEAVRSFLLDEVDRIILVRPVVEAGENLGFLPGDLQEKVEPYFRPLYDALLEMIQPEKLKKFMDLNRIEVAPLAYMRGRTLSKAFVILDEAQNTTDGQLKMFLTRLGRGSKAIITGDLTQIDLVNKSESGLQKALGLLSDIKGISSVTLNQTDVVRHFLVREIIKAYEADNSNNGV